MNVPEIALRHQRLDARAAQLRAQIERQEAQLAGDPEVERLRAALEGAQAEWRELELRLRDRDREVESHRGRLRSRERELMSGRIRSPGELMKLDEEVRHLRASLSTEEDAEIELMEQEERLDRLVADLGRQLAGAEARVSEAAPALRSRIDQERAELADVEQESTATWDQLPADWQTMYRRVGSRMANPIAEVVGGQCQACRVGVTTNGMQVLRRAGLLTCDNCGRILVVA
jgi:predicted  nucleic acid-binding Zn-ribbon protein